MGGSPKRGGSNGSGALMSRGRVILVTVLVLQLVLVACFMKAPSLIWSEEIDASAALDEGAPTVSSGSGSWLWRLFGISTTAPRCVDANGRVVTEAVRGSAIKCSDRSSFLRVKWIEPEPGEPSTRTPKWGGVPSPQGPVLRRVNATTVFRNSHGAIAGLRGPGSSRLRSGRAIGDERSSSSVVGDLRHERVQMGRDLPATGDGDAPTASDAEAARGTGSESASWRMRREFAANIRSSLERDSIRFRARTVGYGDVRQRSREEYLRAREGDNAGGVIAREHASNVSATIAPGSRVTPNVNGMVAPVASVGAKASDSKAPIARIRPSTLIVDDEQSDDEEAEVDELAETEPEVAVARSEERFEARREPLPILNADRSNTSLEISKRSDTSLEISPTSTSLAGVSPSNTSLIDISSGNSSLEISPTSTSLEISPSNTSLTDISSGNSSLEISPTSTSLEISPGNTSLAEISSGNSSLEISPTSTSLENSTKSDTSLTETSSGNSRSEISPTSTSSEISPRNTSLDLPSESLARNSTSLVEFEQVSSPLIAPSAAAAQNFSLRNATAAIASTNTSTCPQGLLYVYTLPKKFNTELLENCSQLLDWRDRCEELSNSGLGTHLQSSPLPNQQNASSGPWYATDQFNSEVIFHQRILAHPCRTHNPELAKAFFIPYYGGLDVARFLFNVTNKKFTSLDRDRLGKELVAWLARSPYWKRHQGSDHVLFLGRITWDFRRKGSHGWGSGLLHMPEMANVTKLSLERDTWDESETAVPYPTTFHPRNDSEVMEWQKEVRERKRDLLFSFAGGKRQKYVNDFRVALFEQCEKAESCAVLDCSREKCQEDALATTKLFMRSTFCLQPRGDSFTRRSIFDALVAGCIPVFFWTKTAYLQYRWHFPTDPQSYSVFISKQDIQEGRVQIKDVLSKIPPAQVRQMQETVIDMIPRMVYAQGLVKFRDAFDTTIDQVMTNFQSRVQHQNATNGATEFEAGAAPGVVESKPVGAVQA